MKCYHGDVLSVNAANDTFHWLVEDEGKIVFVGNDLPERFQNAQRVELGEKALCPSFVDTHQHLASFSTFHAGLNVMDAASNREISDLIRDFVRRSSAKTMIAFGASPYSVAEGRLISRAELDAVCPDKEIMVVKYDGHACVVNSKLYELVQKKVTPLRGCHADTGEMNQEAFFAVSDFVTNSVPVIQLVKNMQRAADDLAKRGIGMIHSVSGVGFTGDLDVDLERWFAGGLKNGLQMRVYMQTLDVKKALKRKLPRIGGCFLRKGRIVNKSKRQRTISL
jgi:predicted amidohydrolase YtcJ